MIDTEQAIGIMYHGYSKLLPPDGLPCGLVGAWCLDNTRLFFYAQSGRKGRRKRPQPEGCGYQAQGFGRRDLQVACRSTQPGVEESVGATFRSRAVRRSLKAAATRSGSCPFSLHIPAKTSIFSPQRTTGGNARDQRRTQTPPPAIQKRETYRRANGGRDESPALRIARLCDNRPPPPAPAGIS